MANTEMMTGGVNKIVAMVAGAVLVLVGLLGFVGSPVLGIFEVNLIHNLIHLLSGAVLLGAAFMNGGANARMTVLVLGIVYALVAIVGFIAPAFTQALLGDSGTAGFTYDNFLHLFLAVVFIGVPLFARENTTRPMRGRPM